MTGLTPGQVRGVIRRKGFIAEHVVPKAEKPQPKVEPKVESNRLEIHVNNESDLAQRVAYDAAKYIERKMNPGDAWLTGKEMMAKFEIGNRTTTEVRRILVSHDWIEYGLMTSTINWSNCTPKQNRRMRKKARKGDTSIVMYRGV
jgi:hypothetical protein